MAQCLLGVLHHSGDVELLDFNEAARWYRLSADQGEASAQYNLGLLYLDGRGVSKDYIGAYMWFAIAAARGSRKRNQASPGSSE